MLCVRALASSDAIGGDVSARRPSHSPTSAASTHHPAATGITSESARVGGRGEVTAASALAAPALSSTVIRRKSVNRTSVVSVGVH